MKCRICNNEVNNKPLIIKEMMFGLKDTFDYFQCSDCECIQIAKIPADMSPYYPSNYYSYNMWEVPLKRSWIRKVHFDHFIYGKYKILGALISLKYKPSQFFYPLKGLDIKNRNERILDIGCGNGHLLKRMYRLGFNDLTGVDPYLKEDVIYNQEVRVYKKDIFDLDGKYDIIMMQHSLEHMDGQQEVLEKAASLLSDTGRLVIGIPLVSEPLMEKYGTNVVSLDAPRHFYIHSLKSITKLATQSGLKIYKTIFDASMLSILISEEYQKGISMMNDERSYTHDPANSRFSKKEIEAFTAEINKYNQRQQSDSVILYLHKK